MFSDAQKLADTWLGRLYLGRASLDAGNFAAAASEFEACQKRRGEATSVFLDDQPSYHEFPQVLYYLGRAQEGAHQALTRLARLASETMRPCQAASTGSSSLAARSYQPQT